MCVGWASFCYSALGCMCNVNELTLTVNLDGPLNLELPRIPISGCIYENISREVFRRWEDPRHMPKSQPEYKRKRGGSKMDTSIHMSVFLTMVKYDQPPTLLPLWLQSLLLPCLPSTEGLHPLKITHHKQSLPLSSSCLATGHSNRKSKWYRVFIEICMKWGFVILSW